MAVIEFTFHTNKASQKELLFIEACARGQTIKFLGRKFKATYVNHKNKSIAYDLPSGVGTYRQIEELPQFCVTIELHSIE
jgi:hypothetical protein